MNKLLIAAALSLGLGNLTACATVPVDRVGAAVAGVVAAETAASLRCPRSPAELALLTGARLAFDASFGSRLADTQRSRIEAARAMTDRACGLLVQAAEPSAPGLDERETARVAEHGG